MKILVTGGAGYIGSHATVCFLQADHEVVVLDDFSNSKPQALERIKQITGKQFGFYEVNLLDYEGTHKVFQENDFDAVVHFAGLKAVGESVAEPLRYYHNNITGTLNLLDIMQKSGVKRIVFSSSATVYGDPQSVPINESAPTGATNPYGRTKLTIEHILKDLYVSDNQWDIAILRYFNPVGAHESGLIGEDPCGIPNNLVPYISKVASGSLECVSVYGNDYNTPDGTGVRDYIHVMDLAEGHLLALEKLMNKVGVLTYNLGTGRGYSVLEVIQAFSKACGKKIEYKIVERRPGDIAVCYAEPQLARQELGFEAKKTIDEMCESCWKWQEGNPNGYQ